MQEDEHSRQTVLGQNEPLRLEGTVQEVEHSRQTVFVHDVQAICSFYVHAHPSPMAQVDGLPAVAGRRSIIWRNRSADRNWYLGTAGVLTARGITTFWEMLGVTGRTGVGGGMTMGVAAGAGTKKL